MKRNVYFPVVKKNVFGELYVRFVYVKDVIYNNPATIVFWSDGEKTVVKCGKGDTYDAEKGLFAAIAKRTSGNHGCFNDIYDKFEPKAPIEKKEGSNHE